MNCTNNPAMIYSYQIVDNYEIDIEDLEGIIQQLDAILLGWGMDFNVVVKDEDPDNYFIWEKL